MSSILEVRNLYKTYGHGDIFKNVSFTLEPGETLGLFGISGCGKSTLGRCILGLEKVTSGTILFEGIDLASLHGKKRSLAHTKMQMIFQHPEISLDPRKKLVYSVTEPVMYHEHRNPDEIFQSLIPLMESVGLDPGLFQKYPTQLSGGELQRAMMVRIYSLSPRLVVADEPTSMLDMSTQAQILHLMKELQKKNQTASLFITHDPEVILAMCDRIGMLVDGKFTLLLHDEFRDRINPLLIKPKKES